MNIKQRDVVHIDLDPVKGREQRGARPAVVISGDAFHVSGLCIICPLTTSIHNFMGDPILAPGDTNGLAQTSEILVWHMRSVSIGRINKKIGVISSDELDQIFRGVDLLLNR